MKFNIWAASLIPIPIFFLHFVVAFSRDIVGENVHFQKIYSNMCYLYNGFHKFGFLFMENSPRIEIIFLFSVFLILIILNYLLPKYQIPFMVVCCVVTFFTAVVAFATDFYFSPM